MNLKMQGQETSSQIFVDLKVSYCGYFGQFPMFEALSTDTEPRCPWTARCTKHRKDQCDSQDLLLLNCSLKTYKLGLQQKKTVIFIATFHCFCTWYNNKPKHPLCASGISSWQTGTNFCINLSMQNDARHQGAGSFFPTCRSWQRAWLK